MFPREFADVSQPRPGYIWLRRDEQHFAALTIIVSDEYRERNVSPLAVVDRFGPGAEDAALACGLPLEVGDTVLLAMAPSTLVKFGDGHDEIEFWVVEAHQILGMFKRGSSVPKVQDMGQYPLGRYPLEMGVAELADAIRATEGTFQGR